MSDEKDVQANAATTSCSGAPYLAFEHFTGDDQQALWRVVVLREFSGRMHRMTSWYMTEKEAWAEANRRLDKGHEVLSVKKYVLDLSPCDHDWIDIRNEVIESGTMCRKCGRLSH